MHKYICENTQTSSRDDGVCPSHHFFIVLSSLHHFHLGAFAPENTQIITILEKRRAIQQLVEVS